MDHGLNLRLQINNEFNYKIDAQLFTSWTEAALELLLSFLLSSRAASLRSNITKWTLSITECTALGADGRTLPFLSQTVDVRLILYRCVSRRVLWARCGSGEALPLIRCARAASHSIRPWSTCQGPKLYTTRSRDRCVITLWHRRLFLNSLNIIYDTAQIATKPEREAIVEQRIVNILTYF